ncbi:hypothetical protein [Agromyces sp. SYSU T00194]|uniref:hypothetical protein n=1 Tax=Agromyces chitinivorans TaxID=3158560 RepID=UPI003391A525
MIGNIVIGAAAAGLLAVGLAAPAHAAPPDCNWGQLTKYAISEVPGYSQGEHSSAFAGSPRVGLPNVPNELLGADVSGRDKLQATCEFIAGELP